MKKEPETYEELIRQRRCVDLMSNYELTEDEVEQIYQFLTDNPKGQVIGGLENLSLKVGKEVKMVIASKRTNFMIDGLTMSNTTFNVIPHYTPSSSSRSSSGRSSNNNNNNNNNNNR